MEPLRSVKLSSGHILNLFDLERVRDNHAQLAYELLRPDTSPLFKGEDYGCAPSHAADSDAALLALLSFLTLRKGDTDAEYTAAMIWAKSSECESLRYDIRAAEEAGGCACTLWENLDGHKCPDAPTVTRFQVLDHGEDGSQYFPGCGHGDFAEVATGVGDTGAEALADALESMAQNDATVSPLQEHWMRAELSDPDKSAFAGLDHSDCGLNRYGEDESEHDWHHYVSIRYDVRR